MAPKIYLASASPRRRELLEQISVDFELLKVDVAEFRGENESPHEYVRRLAQDKALAGVAIAEQNWPVLGADTIVVLGEKVLEKPVDKADAVAMLQLLSENTHRVITAVCIADSEHLDSDVICTEVTFTAISLPQIEAYWQTGEPKDKAGSYGIQGIGGQFVKRINGSYSSVVGLPLVETRELLEKFRVSTRRGI